LGQKHASSLGNEGSGLVNDDARLEARSTVIDSLRSDTDDQLVENFKTACRHLSNPVVLITSRLSTRNSELNGEHDFGVTVSSFTSVSVDPDALVSFNLKLPSASWNAISSSGRLRVHILRADETGAAIADLFAQPSSEGPFVRLLKTGVEVRLSSTEPASLNHVVGVVGNLTAELVREKCVECGDHMIVVAKVVACAGFTAAETIPDTGFEGLTYFNRSYRRLGDCIEPKLPSPELKPDEAVKEDDRRKRARLFIDRLNAERSAAAQRRGQQQIRSFSTTTGLRHAEHDNTSHTDDATHLIDPAAKEMTVADFLEMPANNKPPKSHPPRMRKIAKCKEHVEKAEEALAQHSSRESRLSKSEVEQQLRIIRAFRRTIDVELAHVAALDLRTMLDRGRSDHARAAWLEKTIEKGLVICQEDAIRAKELLDARKMDQRQFDKRKSKLLAKHDLFKIEVDRLRSSIIEENEG
jgi:flavin reductase (DIM6/NTAB) family NADH-FMN oxidoreductase RutF